MYNNIAQITASPCSGCGACIGICSQHAIQLQMNQAGFLVAALNEKQCSNCGLCMQVCPRVVEYEGIDLYKIQPLALQSSDPEVVKNSSSGGIAHELARAAISNGDKAAGAVYDLDSDTVKHQIIDSVDRLKLLDGSKYLQSNTEEFFQDICEQAKSSHITCLGTPCQIAGLANLAKLRKVRDNLLLVEIFCHGVPSYKIWEEQMRRIRKKIGEGKFTAVSFRDKSQGWHTYRLTAANNTKSWSGNREKALFWHAFFEDVLLNDSCYTCKARLSKSAADIRIGDYWGKKYQSRTDGVSLVFPLTEAGKAQIDILEQEGFVHFLETQPSDEVLVYQTMRTYPANPLHESAIQQLNNGERIETVIRNYRKKQLKKAKLRRLLLRASGLLPAQTRQALKKLRMR